MVRLSSRTHIEQSISATWMHQIHKYFEDLLVLPITGGKYDQDDFLDDSPFSSSIFGLDKRTVSSRHLQRLTIFLFLKCSLKLVSTKGSPGQPQCDLKLDSECCSNSNTSIELHEWLQSHVPADILLNDELYFKRCMRFTLSFLQLFMDEVCSHSLILSLVVTIEWIFINYLCIHMYSSGFSYLLLLLCANM